MYRLITFAKILAAFILFSTCLVANGHAQNGEISAKQLHPYPLNNDIDIDGTLSHPAWEAASPIFIRHEVQPNDQAAAPVQTKVKALYSNNHLYIGFISKDPNPGKIRASISDRDESFNDDFVGIFLDTFDNNQQAYEFFVNPLGIQMDGIRSNGNEDMNFDALWYSKGAVNDSGYTAVMKIPFKSLNFPTKNVQDWSIQALRNYPRNVRHQLVWTDVSTDNPCLICQNGRLAGLRGLENNNTVELLPYAMSYQNSAINDSDNPSSGLDHEPIQGRLGGSVS